MSELPKMLLLAAGAAVVAVSAFVETPFAQSNVSGANNGSQQSTGTQAAANSDPELVDKKAEAAMMAAPNSVPPTDADTKAGAAMSK